MRLILKYAIVIILIDRWIFGPIRAALVKKGPIISIRRPKAARRIKRKVDKMKSWKVWTWGAGAIVGVAVIAIVAMYAWAWIKAKIDAARNPAPAAPVA